MPPFWWYPGWVPRGYRDDHRDGFGPFGFEDRTGDGQAGTPDPTGLFAQLPRIGVSGTCGVEAEVGLLHGIIMNGGCDTVGFAIPRTLPSERRTPAGDRRGEHPSLVATRTPNSGRTSSVVKLLFVSLRRPVWCGWTGLVGQGWSDPSGPDRVIGVRWFVAVVVVPVAVRRDAKGVGWCSTPFRRPGTPAGFCPVGVRAMFGPSALRCGGGCTAGGGCRCR